MLVTCVFAAVLALSARAAQAAYGTPVIVEFGPTFDGLGGIAIAPDGTIWVAEEDGVARLSRDGSVLKEQRAKTIAREVATGEIGIGPDGSVWTNGWPHITRFLPSGRVQSYRLVPIVPGRPTLLDFLHAATRAFAASRVGVYAARNGEPYLRRLDRASVVVEPASVDSIALGADGGMWLMLQARPDGLQELTWVAPSGVATHDVASAYLATHRLGPYAAVSSDGSLVTEAVANASSAAAASAATSLEIVRISEDGSVAELARILEPMWRWREPWPVTSAWGHLAIGTDGAIWFTEPYANRVGRIAPDRVLRLYRVGLPIGAMPYGIAVDADGSAWFTDSARDTLDHLSVDGRLRIVGSGLTPDNRPGGPVVTSDGSVWFRETFGWRPRIARLRPTGAVEELPDIARSDAGMLQSDGAHVINVTPYGVARISLNGTTRALDTAGCLVAGDRVACLPRRRSIPEPPYPSASPNSVVRGPDGALWFTERPRA